MADYTQDELKQMTADGLAFHFVKEVDCYLVPADDDDVNYIMDNGDVRSGRAVLKDRDGHVYLLDDKGSFERFIGGATRLLRGIGRGVGGILESPLVTALAGAAGWTVPKFLTRMKGLDSLDENKVAEYIRDKVGATKAGKIITAVKEHARDGAARVEDTASKLEALIDDPEGD